MGGLTGGCFGYGGCDGTDKVGLARWAGFVGVCALFMFFCEVLSWWRGALACPVTSGRELASDGMGGAVLPE